MSAALRKLHAVRRACSVPDELYRDILKNQTGRDSAKGIGFRDVNKCVAEFEKLRPAEPTKLNWRPTAKSAHARKVYALWTDLKKQGKVTPRYPDAFVKRMADVDRAEFLTPTQANPVIEALRDWKHRKKSTTAD